MQSTWQLLRDMDIINSVEFSTVREQNQGFLGVTQSIRQIANGGKVVMKSILPL